MAIPTLTGSGATAWNSTTTPKTAAITTAVGDFVVIYAAIADTGATLGTPTNTGTAETWTLRQSDTASAQHNPIYIWTTTATAAQTTTVSVTRAGTALNWGFHWQQWTSDGIGTSNKAITTGAPSLDLTLVGVNSAVGFINADWNAVDGASRAYLPVNGSTGTERFYFSLTGSYTVYVNTYADAGIDAQTVGLSAPTGQRYSIAAIEIFSAPAAGTVVTPAVVTAVADVPTSTIVVPVRVPIPVSFGATSAWVKPASSVTVTPLYPADDNLDLITAVLCIKPATATVATPANWAVGPNQAVGGGTQGAGTGACDAHVFTRVSNGALSGGSQAFTITSGSSPVGHMKAWKYDATGYDAPQWEPITHTFYSRTTASTTYGGTGAVNLNLEAGDVLLYVSITPDDQSLTHTINTLSAAGCTLATRVQSPAGTVVNSQGNDISASSAYALVTAGASTGPPVATVTGNSAETGGGIFYRIRATAASILTVPALVAVSTVAAVATAGATPSAAVNVAVSSVAAVATANEPVVVEALTPPTVATAVAVNTPTFTSAATSTPATAAVVGLVGSPTVTGTTEATPTVVPTVGSVGSPTVTSTARKTINAAVAAAVQVGTPLVTGTTTVDPAAVAGVAGVGAATVIVDVTVDPAAVPVVADVGSPTVTAATTVNRTVVAATTAVGLPTVDTANNATVTPVSVATVGTVGAPTVTSTATLTTLTPAAARAFVGTPTITATVIAAPATVAALAVPSTPSLQVEGTAAVGTIRVAAVAAVPTPAVRLGVVIPTDAAVVVADVPAATVTTSATRIPALAAVRADVPTPTVLAHATPLPAATSVVAAIPTVVVSVHATAMPVAVAAVATALTPALQTAGNVTAQTDTVAAVAVVPTPVASVGETISTVAVAAAANVAAPTIRNSATVTPVAVAALTSVPTPTISPTANVAAAPVSAVAAVSAPVVVAVRVATVAATRVAAVATVGTVTFHAHATPTPGPVHAAGTVPAVVASGRVTATVVTVVAVARVGAALFGGGNVGVPVAHSGLTTTTDTSSLTIGTAAHRLTVNTANGLAITTNDANKLALTVPTTGLEVDA